MLVRYRGINNKGVLERPGTKWRVLKSISMTMTMTMTATLLFDDCRWSHKPPYKERQETPLGVQGCSAKVQCRSNMLPDPPAWQRGCWEGSFIHTNHTPRTRTHETTNYPYACALDINTKTKTLLMPRGCNKILGKIIPGVSILNNFSPITASSINAIQVPVKAIAPSYLLLMSIND